MMGVLQSGVDLSTLVEGVNLLWVLTVTFLIFFMHAGFAMLEAGQVRSKNVANQLTKNMLTWSIGVIAFFLLGAGISSLVGGLTGGGDYAVSDLFAIWSAGSADWVSWLFGAVFAMTAATIVSGAVAGRAKLRAYVSYTILLAAVIYPVVVGFTWAGASSTSSASRTSRAASSSTGWVASPASPRPGSSARASTATARTGASTSSPATR